MKPLTTKIALSVILLLVKVVAFSQHPTEAEFFKNKAYAGYKLVDTTRATSREWAIIHRQRTAMSLKNDHYYYEYPISGNLGVRFVKTEGPKTEIYEGLRWGKRKLFKSVMIDGKCAIEFSALDVNEKNAADYRYHVMQNDNKELVTWTSPNVFKYTADSKYKYAYLGKFDYVPGQVLTVEIYNIHDYAHLDAFMIDWRKVEAANLLGFIDYFSPRFSRNGVVFSKGITDLQHTTEKAFDRQKGMFERPVSTKDFIETTSKNDIKFRMDDSVRSLSFIINNGERSYNYKVSLKRETVENRDSISLGEVNDRFNLNREFWKTPGKYKITFTPKIYRHGGEPMYLLHNLDTSISFTVLPPLNKIYDVPIKTVAYIILILLTTGGFMFMMYRRQQQQKLAREAQNKQIATLQLQSVRAQLNPHFIFNALAGIQNLINKNAIEDANKYLSRFARLTRNVLDEGHKDLISIEQEISLLDDYMQMEQTRFGFKFNITVARDIDKQIEIPAMLVQPFAENAVKHGVSSLKDKGMVTINIDGTDADITLTIHDNGKGFNKPAGTGKGIKLCEERIALLNCIYKKSTILLRIETRDEGTTITIHLKNWL